MLLDRRSLFQTVGGLSAGLAGLSALPSARAAEPSLTPLIDAGLRPLDVYAQMFAAKTDGAECCWWFMGALPIDVEDVGIVETVQEETLRLHRVEVEGPDKLHIRWKEAGVFRDIITGEVPSELVSPITGKVERRLGALGGSTARFTIEESGANTLNVTQELTSAEVGPITVDGQINGARICLTHVEIKTRNMGGTTPRTMRTVFKIYADVDEVKSGKPSVDAIGFYGVRNVGTGDVFVNGYMAKAEPDEKLNPIAWERIKAARPEYFDGDRFRPRWD